jgi:AAA+ superfamily predicted ATPase
VRHQLVVLGGDQPGDEPLPLRSLRADEHVVAFLLGGDQIDGRLAGVVTRETQPVGWEQLSVDRADLERLRGLVDWWPRSGGATLLLHGPYGTGRLAIARAISIAPGRPLLIADATAAARDQPGFEQLVDLCYREARLQGAAIAWVGCESLYDREQPSPAWDYLLTAAEQFDGLSCLISTVGWDPVGRFRQKPFLHIELPAPGYQVRRALWLKHLPSTAEFAEQQPDRARLAEGLANSFQITEGQIQDAIISARGVARQRAPLQPRLTADDLYLGCRRQSARRLMTFARLIEPRPIDLDSLVLPQPHKRQLGELRERIVNRSRVYTDLGFEQRLSLGRGLIALFTGGSGTGKTMAAEALAYKQGVELYKVDLAAVVSKYVGETEKNLNRLFAEARDTNAMLFFDEADALFGKRSEVKEAQDRWANMEVNHLLAMLEEYAGVAILASNRRQDIDEAFMRRFHVAIEFPFPDADARYQILAGLFPPGVQPPGKDDLRELAERFRLSGGNLKNIVLDAAFRAMRDTGADPLPISMRHLVSAIAREYQKLGNPITQSEFSERFYTWLEEDILS